MVPWAHPVYPPISISIGSAIFTGQTDTQTDHATPSVAIGLSSYCRSVAW